jgi:hypothetical protein
MADDSIRADARVPAARLALFACCGLLFFTTTARAQASSPPVSVAVAARTAFEHAAPANTTATNTFTLDSVRLFLSGPVTDTIKVTFDTEYDSASNQVQVMDAIGRFEYSPHFNVWMGRFLPPSDRANLYGPYYASNWGIYTDGVQDGYPFITEGRANGVAYWGQYGMFSASGGVFDGPTATGDTTPIGAGRLQVDFWDREPGYYSSGTYYGSKNVLGVGVAGQVQGEGHTAVSADLLLERKVTGGGAVSLEGELARYHGLGGYDPRYTTDQGGYVLASYLLPVLTGTGRFQLLGKVARAGFSGGFGAADADYHQTTTEVNVNYIMKGYDARIMVFYLETRFDGIQSNDRRIGVGLQLQK